jgi:hypothetical protein
LLDATSISYDRAPRGGNRPRYNRCDAASGSRLQYGFCVNSSRPLQRPNPRRVAVTGNSRRPGRSNRSRIVQAILSLNNICATQHIICLYFHGH